MLDYARLTTRCGQGKHTVLYDIDGDVLEENLAEMRWTLLLEAQEHDEGAHIG